MSILKPFLNITQSEWKPMVLSFGYFFFLMSSYFIMRPVRDEMGILAGIGNMQWLFTGTFVAMVALVPFFGFMMKKVSRKRLIPAIYLFFIANILGFYAGLQLLDLRLVSVVFFIWLSVYNLFVVSVFWSFNADVFSADQARRLYGPIAAGGSCGAILGPAITSSLVGVIGVANLLLIAAGLLSLSTVCVILLIKVKKQGDDHAFCQPLGGNIWDGLRLLIRSPMLVQISFFILLYSTISTFLYFEQAHIVSEALVSSEQRTTYFGIRDLTINTLTLIIQFFLTGKLLKKYSVAVGLIIVPVVSGLGFFLLGLIPSIYILFVVQVLYRSLNFSIQRPTREVIFTAVSANERYRSKNFIDTALYRGGDALSGWLFTGASSILGSLQLVSFVTIPIAVVWIGIGLKVGKLFNRKSVKIHENVDPEYFAQKSA